MGDVLVADDFRGKVNQKFTMVDVVGDEDEGEDACALDLTECTDREPQDFPGKTRDPFSLVFKARSDDLVVSQRIFKLSHDDMGEIEVFLVPIGPDPKDGKMLYQAVYS